METNSINSQLFERETYTIREFFCGQKLYEVQHGPIDYTAGVENTTDSYSHTWGLDRIFKPIEKDSALYEELYSWYTQDEPSFIGGCLVPFSSGVAMEYTYVYVVRCINNETTYFLSLRPEALRLFTQ